MQKYIRILAVFLAAGLWPAPMSCSAGFAPTDVPTQDSGDQGGSTSTDTLFLPFAAGEDHLCTQGVGGSYSHNSSNTAYGLDLDTSNVSNEDVYAPCSGVAFVHYDASPSGFGIHINIDRGDGTYCVLAHLSEVFIQSEEEPVSVGQYLGFDGSTGNSTGDHVHFGLMQGDASQMAQYGTSIPASFYARDVTSGSGFEVIPGEDFVCDLSNGHSYDSGLATAKWHPDGTLLKYPGGSEVFVVDAGDLFWIEDEDVFASFGFDFGDVVAMPEVEYYECFGEASEIIDWTTEYRGLIDEDGVTWVAFEKPSDPGRFRLPIRPYQDADAVEAVLDSWGIPGAYGPYQQESAELLGYPVGNGYACLRDGTLVSEQGSSSVYVIHEGLALPIDSWDTLALMGFASRRIYTVPEGTLDELTLDRGNCSAGIGCVTRNVVTDCGAGLDLSLLDTDPDWGGIDGDDDDTGSDDDDAIGDDDDSDPDGDDDDATDDDDDDTDPLGDDDDTVADPWMLLEISAGLNGAPADYIWLQGELLDENGMTVGGGFWWASLGIEYNANSIEWSAYVKSDWTFRYSVEFERYGVVAWSCSTPFPPGSYNMDLTASVDGVPVIIDLIDNYLGGCETFIEVP